MYQCITWEHKAESINRSINTGFTTADNDKNERELLSQPSANVSHWCICHAIIILINLMIIGMTNGCEKYTCPGLFQLGFLMAFNHVVWTRMCGGQTALIKYFFICHTSLITGDILEVWKHCYILKYDESHSYLLHAIWSVLRWPCVCVIISPFCTLYNSHDDVSYPA